MNGSHVEICFDVGNKNMTEIMPPSNFIEKVLEEAEKIAHCKIVYGLKVQFQNPDNDIKEWYVSHRAVEYEPDFMDKVSLVLAEKISNYSEMGSGWKMIKVLQYCFKLIKTSPIPYLSGRSYIKSPERLVKSKSTVNIMNEDNLCFIYSILAVQNYSTIHHHRERVTNYVDFLKDLNFSPEDMPMKIKDIPKFERCNPQLSINVLKYNNEADILPNDEDIVKNPHVDLIYRSKNQDGDPIHLLLLEKADNYHYLAITNLDRLLNMRIKNELRIQCKFWCHKCLHGFRYETGFVRHLPMCESNDKFTTLYKMPKQKFCEFADFSKTMSPPFIVYADFESVLVPSDIYENIHLPASAGLLLLGPNGMMHYDEFSGPDSIFNFILALESIVKNKVSLWHQNAKMRMIPLSNQQKKDFQDATQCYLCKKTSEKYVMDHCHVSGQYLGAACNKCNLSRQIRCVLPVFFHNLKGYDMHHILKHAISNFPNYNLSIIPQTKEKFSTMTVYMKMDNEKTASIKFLDSFQFLSTSLKTLASNLDDHPITKTAFPSEIINGKGIFPYTAAKSFNELKTINQLPPKWDNITDEEYNEASQVWIQYGCTNLLEYMLIYMKLDIYLLADVFEKFRKQVKEEENLEAANFVSLPAMSWCMAIKSSTVQIELIQDPEMYFFFQNGIRGGMTFINKHRVKADETTSLLYIDVNNLYGWALSQPLPYGKFKWIYDEEELNNLIEMLPYSDTENEERGFVFEVDLIIPPEEHDKLDQLPLAPINQCPPGSKVKKLILSHEEKKNYVIHYRLLQLFLELGAKVSKIHRAVAFNQSCIFKSYIDSNSQKRALANNDFEKDFYKLKNNSLYGKTVENLMKRMNLRLCNNEKRLITYASRSQFKDSFVIADNLVAVLMAKDEVILDRPSYIGQAVLDLSKLRMYNLQYKELQSYRDRFACEINIIAGDTDSFFLECKNVDLRKQLIPAMISDNLLDTSNYDKDDPLYSNALKAVIGKFKDENKGLFDFIEWIFLRPKSYSLLKSSTTTAIMKSKGISLKQTDIAHQNYVDTFENAEVQRVQQTRICSVNHQLFTIISSKKALDPFDDKRQWTDKNESVAYGHYSL